MPIADSDSSVLDSYVFEQRSDEVPGPRYLHRQSSNVAVVNPPAVVDLDRTQRAAFVEATTREVAIIQGPPGTGKTFTSNVILQSLVRTQVLPEMGSNAEPPVLIAAQTNHAVDQLLGKYIGVVGSGKVARLGGRSNTEIQELSLSNLMNRARGFRRPPVGQFLLEQKRAHVNIVEALKRGATTELQAARLLDQGLLSMEQYESLFDDEWESNGEQTDDKLQTWLGQAVSPGRLSRLSDDWNEHNDIASQARDAREVKRDKQWRQKVIFLPFPEPPSNDHAWSSQYCKRLLTEHQDLYKIRPEDRMPIYQYWQTCLQGIDPPRGSLDHCVKAYTQACESILVAKTENKATFVKSRGLQVIGCTATGLLKYRDVLRRLRPKVLLLEEAAEIREADTMATCLSLPSLEHLVLVGDHQQLQPHVNLHELSEHPFRINISMFERLIKLLVPHQTLLRQRRMIPCLREIVQTFYSNLDDHAATISKLPTRIPGVLKPLWWFQHDWLESQSRSWSKGIESTSISNYPESRMIMYFMHYLIYQGISPTRITILTFYNGQVDQIKRQITEYRPLAALISDLDHSVRSVDGFQGEENDIILLSTVRGPNGRAGFLHQANRAVVALSRARLGLYIFGHRKVLLEDARARETWSKVFEAMQECTGRALPCLVGGRRFNVRCPEEMRRVLRRSRILAQGDNSDDSAASLTSEAHSSERSEVDLGHDADAPEAHLIDLGIGDVTTSGAEGQLTTCFEVALSPGTDLLGDEPIDLITKEFTTNGAEGYMAKCPEVILDPGEDLVGGGPIDLITETFETIGAEGHLAKCPELVFSHPADLLIDFSTEEVMTSRAEDTEDTADVTETEYADLICFSDAVLAPLTQQPSNVIHGDRGLHEMSLLDCD